MSKREKLTIEVDVQLKDQLERIAQTRRVAVEQIAREALVLAGQSQCPTCGRGTDGAPMPVGMSTAFEKFVDEYKSPGHGPVLITTLEAGKQKAYWVRLRADRELEGMVLALALLGAHGNATLPIGIPRGVITGWRGDADGTWYGMCVALGYEDGNAPARQVALLMRQQGQL